MFETLFSSRAPFSSIRCTKSHYICFILFAATSSSFAAASCHLDCFVSAFMSISYAFGQKYFCAGHVTDSAPDQAHSIVVYLLTT